MRRISELTAEEAIDFWYDNGVELTTIFKNPNITEAKDDNADMAKAIVKECPNEIKKILLWIDSDPITPFNLFPRLFDFLTDMQSEGTSDFFTSACKKEDMTASADATENTEETEH